MKIYFFLLPQGSTTTTFANKLIAEALQKKGFNVEIIYNIDQKYTILDNCDADIIFFQKTFQCDAHTAKHLTKLKNKVFLCHIDDDFLDMNNETHIETLNLTDLILVATESNKINFKNYTNQPIEVIKHVLDFENYPYTPLKNKNNNPLIISWQQSCADAYTKDLVSISAPLNALHKKYDFHLNLYGWHNGLDFPDNSSIIRKTIPFANLIPFQPLDLYTQNLIPELSKSDIYILPYLDTLARSGKSAFSLKRIMLLGIPIVASNLPHNRTLITDGIDGFLATTEEEWYYKLENLILNPNLRASFSEKLRLKMDTEFNENVVIENFIHLIRKHYPRFSLTI